VIAFNVEKGWARDVSVQIARELIAKAGLDGMPEPVPYVYRQQKRRNDWAARIARRNAQGWWQPPAVSAP